MDERLELTAQQMELAKKFNELCEEMSNVGIGFINRPGNIYLINLNHVDRLVCFEEMVLNLEDEVGKYDEQLVDYDDMVASNIKPLYTADVCDDNLGIRFKQRLWKR